MQNEINNTTIQANDINMTNLETLVLSIIKSGDWFEEMPTEGFKNIMQEFQGSKNQLKGVLGSLSKKGFILIGEYPNGQECYHYNVK
jgi:predicted RNA-binding protein (virulence factor B family)